MPQVGEKRTAGGETREWTGSRWTGVGAPEGEMPMDDLLARADALSAGGGNAEKSYDPVQKLIGPQNIPAAVRNLKDPDAGSNHKTYFQEHPNVPIQETTNPLAAMLGSGAQTAGRVAKGAAMAVPNAITSLPDLPMQVVKGYGGLTELAHDPSLLMEAPGALKEGFDYIGENPEAGGELLAQIALGKVAPAATEGAMRLGSAGLEAARNGLGKAGRITGGVAKALAPEFLSKRMNAIGQVFNEVRKGGNEAAPRPTADWSADASARPEWDPAGPSKRAAGQAGRAGANTPEGAGSNITMDDLLDEGNVNIGSPDPFQSRPNKVFYQGDGGYVDPATEVSPLVQARRDLVKKFNETEVQGKDRTTGYKGKNDFGMGGLANSHPLPMPQPQNPAFLDFAEEAPLTDMERLAARSAERFGRRYRPEF